MLSVLLICGLALKKKIPGGEVQVWCSLVKDMAKVRAMTFVLENHLSLKWTMRIKEQQRLLNTDSYDDDDKWDTAFEGMTIY